MRTTCLETSHRALGARMTEFAGYAMPLQYSGVIEEHHACRRQAACFDTGHMGQVRVHGAGIEDALERLVTCRVASLAVGRCRYGLMCNEAGGAVDDLLVYRMGEDDFMLVVNAGTRGADVAWIREHVPADATVEDLSDETGKVDLQGPAAPAIARRLLGAEIERLGYFRFFTTEFGGGPALVSRTGYTGEVGYEFYGAPDQAIAFWDACLDAGAKPAGLGARDTLRLEAGLPLYGHELGAERRVCESGLARSIVMDKDFIGREALVAPPAERLAGIALAGRRAARAGDAVLDADGKQQGTVTSGSFAPSLGHAVALAYLRDPLPPDGTPLQLGRAALEGQVTTIPFWKDGTARCKIAACLGADESEEKS